MVTHLILARRGMLSIASVAALTASACDVGPVEPVGRRST
jgi:hypothetical protein